MFSSCVPNHSVSLRAFLFLAVLHLWVFPKVPSLLSYFFLPLPFYVLPLKGFWLVGLLSKVYLQLLIFFKVNFT